VAYLPGSIQLVAQAPQFDVERIRVAVLLAQIRKEGAAGVVGVLHEFTGRVHAAGTQIDGFHDLHPGLPGPVHKLVQTEGIGFQGVPGTVQAARPGFDRANSILPVVAGDKISARVADHCGTELLDEFHHVPTESVFVRLGVAGLVDAGVDAAAHVFHEGAEDPAGDPADGEVAVNDNPCTGQ